MEWGGRILDSKIISLITLVLIFGIFTVAAENETINQSMVNQSKSTGNVTGVQPLSARVSINVTPTVIDLGIVDPGTERSYPNAATVIIDHQGVSDFYVRASDDLINADGSRIPISYFRFSTPSLNPRPFTTENQWISKYPGNNIEIIPISLYIMVPPYTDPGTYSVTIIYTAT